MSTNPGWRLAFLSCVVLVFGFGSGGLARAQVGALDPVITGFTPDEGGPGTEIDVHGENFDPDPKNGCLEVRNGTRTLTIHVVEASETRLTGVVAPYGAPALIPPPKPWAPAQMFYVRGHGTQGSFKPGFADVTVADVATSWTGVPGAVEAASEQTFAPLDPVAPNGTEWFSSGAPVDGALCLVLDGDWQDDVEVEISLAAHSRKLGAYKLHIPSIRLASGGSTLDCARRICDAIVQAAGQLQGVAVVCDVEERADGRVKLTLRRGDAAGANRRIDAGHLTVCVSTSASSGVRLDDFEPKTAGADTEVALFGVFPSRNHADYCVAVVTDGQFFPFDVLRFEDVDGDASLELIVSTPFPPLKPGPILVQLGQGVRSVPEGVPVVSWAWRGSPDGSRAMSSDVFRPIPDAAPDPDVACFGSFAPEDGKVQVGIICVGLAEGTTFEIRLKVAGEAPGSELAVHIPGCVTRPDEVITSMICDAINSALAMVDSSVVCNTRINEATGIALLEVWQRDVAGVGDPALVEAALHVCVSPRPIPLPVITDFNPKEGDMTTQIVIEGRNFPSDPLAICAAIQPPDTNQPIPLKVMEASPTRIVAIPPVCPWLAGVFTGQIVVTVGRGVEGDFNPGPDWVLEGPEWAWAGQPGPGTQAVSAADYTLTMEKMPGVTILTSDPPSAGQLEVALPTTEWTEGCRVVVGAILFDEVADLGYCLRAAGTQRGEGFGEDLCDVITRGFAQLLGVEVACEVAGDAAGRRNVRLRLPGGQITRGVIVLGLEELSSPAPVITNFGPSEGGPGDVVTIRGSGFGVDPAALSVAAVSGSEAIAFDVVDVSDTVMTARVGAVSPDWVMGPKSIKPGPLWVIRGIGQNIDAKPTPKWTPLSNTRIFQRKGGPASSSGEVFVPTRSSKPVDFLAVGPRGVDVDPPVEPIGCFFGSVEGGSLSLTLRGDWPRDVEVRLRFRAHNSSQLVGTEVESMRGRLPGGPLLDCAQRIADFIRWRLMMFTDTDVEIETIGNADGSVKLAASLLDGVPVEWGVFELCLLPPSSGAGPFLRGDCDGNGSASGNVNDAITSLRYNFVAGSPEPPCLAACDADGNGRATGQVNDAIYMLTFSFRGGPAPIAPYPECGPGSATDEEIGCATPPACGG